MKRNLSKILAVAVALFFAFPLTSYATAYSTPALTGSDVNVDIVGNAEIAEQVRIYYQEVANADGTSFTTYYQLQNVYFDPANNNRDVDPNAAADKIGSLVLYLPIYDGVDPSVYVFGAENPADVQINTDNLFFWGEVDLGFPGGIAQGMYSGVFSVTSPYQIAAGDTILATVWDTSESVDGQMSFALTLGSGSPGTPAPEPGTLVLLGGALLGLAVVRRQRRN
jgi:hypothetical protein